MVGQMNGRVQEYPEPSTGKCPEWIRKHPEQIRMEKRLERIRLEGWKWPGKRLERGFP
jgi:hypothetical protein